MSEQVLNLQQCLQNISFDEFKDSWMLRSMTERALQVSIEIIIDICERIISIEGQGPVDSSSACIDKMVALGVLKKQLPYKNMIKFRNMIVHMYDRVDPKLLYELATSKITDFQLFQSEIDLANKS